MAHTIANHQYRQSYQTVSHQHSPIRYFFEWAASQDEQAHIGWVGISLVASAAIFFPLTMVIVLLTGAHFGLIIAAMVSLVAVLVVNLAAVHTRYTIPMLFLSILADLIIIGIAMAQYH